MVTKITGQNTELFDDLYRIFVIKFIYTKYAIGSAIQK